MSTTNNQSRADRIKEMREAAETAKELREQTLAAKIAKLPVWAREYIKATEYGREEAERKLRDLQTSQTPTATTFEASLMDQNPLYLGDDVYDTVKFWMRGSRFATSEQVRDSVENGTPVDERHYLEIRRGGTHFSNGRMAGEDELLTVRSDSIISIEPKGSNEVLIRHQKRY